MTKLTWLLRIIAILQLVLGLGFLFTPNLLLQAMGHSSVPEDLQYPLGMLAARFIVYGLILFVVSRNPRENLLWIDGMIMIQLIDLGVGIYYTLQGVVPFSLSWLPLFNATWITLLLWRWRPGRQMQAAS